MSAARRFPPPWTAEETSVFRRGAGATVGCPSCSPATRPGASLPTSPSCRSWCVGPEHRATTRQSVISITLTAARRWQAAQRRAEGLLHCYLSPPWPRPRACRSAPVVGATPAHRRQHRQAAGAAAQDLSGAPAYVYSITLSARATNVAGTVTPSALAVLRLITSSNLVGCSTGMSAGLMPRKSLASC